MGLFDFLKKDKEVLNGEEELSVKANGVQQEDSKETYEEKADSEEIAKEQEEAKESVEDSDKEKEEVKNASESKGPEGPKVSNSSFSLLDMVAADDTPIFKDRADEEGFVPPDDEETILEKLSQGLAKTRNSLNQSFSAVFSKSNIDEDFYEELEEILIMADMGVDTTMTVLDELRDKVKEQHIKEPSECRELLIDLIKAQMSLDANAYDYENKTSVVMIIGVNGVGKTTSIGKLAAQFRGRGKKVVLAAADTFRAAAIEQLTEWANRSQVDIIAQSEGSDPSAVVFDAIQASKAREADVLIIDTAGRLHNKKNLMNELSKMNKVIDREWPEANRETMIVLDGTTGQNALEQAKQFKEVADIDGIILTKLDGTAKGGIAIAIHSELGVPVKYIGVGERINDLQKFDPESYVNAIFAVDDEEAGGADETEE